MRELKIRLWDELKKKMWLPENIATIDFESKCAWIKQEYKGGHWVYLKNAKKLQYTGLKDKNGIEIYEGDILKTPNLNNAPTITKVVYLGFGWFEELASSPLNHLTKRFPFSYENEHYSEVIGNIYEHPELLGDSN